MSALVLLIAMGLAAYRAWRFIGNDTWAPAQWFRDQLEYETSHDELAKHRTAQFGTREFFLDEALTWIECPWCLGSWIAGAVVAWCDYLVGLELPLLQWLAVSCIVGLIGSNLDD